MLSTRKVNKYSSGMEREGKKPYKHMANTCGTYQQPSQQKTLNIIFITKTNGHMYVVCKSSNTQHSAHHMCLFRNEKYDAVCPGDIKKNMC